MAAIPAESRGKQRAGSAEKELVRVKAGKTLQLDQARDETAVFSRADPEIDLHEKRMRILVRHDQARVESRSRVRAKRRSSHLGDQVARGRLDFLAEFRGEKNRRLRNAKIRRPDFGLVYCPDERGVFLRRVKSALKRARWVGSIGREHGTTGHRRQKPCRG